MKTTGRTKRERKRYAKLLGARGGAAGTGRAKRRGDSAYYADLGRRSAEARKRKRQETKDLRET